MDRIGPNKRCFLSFHSILVFLASCYCCGLPVYAGEVQVPVHFDFGPEQGEIESGFIAINQHTTYEQGKGYGLVKPADSVFRGPRQGILDKMNYDGVASNESCVFRVDIDSGKYWIEIFMAGGKFSEWQGEIRANNKRIGDTLHQYRVSFERELPPPYWALMRPVTTAGDSLVICVSAKDQVSTLSGISIYKNDPGPLRLLQGKVHAVERLRAPNAMLALHLINKGRPLEAQRLIDVIPERDFRFEKAQLLLALAGRLEVADPRPQLEWAARLLREELNHAKDSAAALNLRLIELYLMADDYYKMAGWDWAKLVTNESIFAHLDLAGRALEEIAQVANHPLYHRAIWYLGKLSFWDWVEEHGAWQKAKAQECFTMLKPYYPGHRLLKMYLGEQLPYREDSMQKYQGAPLWVVTANQALNGLLEIFHYWVDNRQAENGEFGGKYDDDVEMLRLWPIARLAAEDQKILLGMQKLVDGIWNSDWIENGYSRKLRDVEHAAEPVADTQPMMIGLDYGNPVYVERCMESIRGLRDLWTGINSHGHRHFKTSWYSATELDLRPPRDCDVPMNTRTVQAARWLAWYNRHPFAMKFLQEWGDAWLDDCLRTEKGKPYGVVPAAIRFEDDAIGGHADNWYRPGMFWHYYNFNGGVGMLQQFLATYLLTGDPRYLEPIESALKIVAKHKAAEVQQAAEGSEAWVADILRESPEFAQTIEQWRIVTGDSRFDEVILDVGSDYLKFRLTGDKGYLVDGSKHIIDGTRYNRELITTEAYFTDRICIGNIHAGEDWGASHLESMYLGSALLEGFFPFYAISWSGLGADFAAAVLESSPKKVRILVYNLAEEVRKGILSFWMLSPGNYEFLQGADHNDDGVMDTASLHDEFTVRWRSVSYRVELPPRELQIIAVRPKQAALEVIPDSLADLAITAHEVRIARSEVDSMLEVFIPVHNIGIVQAKNIGVELQDNHDGDTVTVARKEIDRIEAPLDLNPRIVEVRLKVASSRIQSENLTVVVDPENRISEITEVNNRVVVISHD